MSGLTTRASMNATSSTAFDQYLSEDSSSVHSFASDAKKEAPCKLYVSTNLITGRNITLADVIAEEVTLDLIS